MMSKIEYEETNEKKVKEQIKNENIKRKNEKKNKDKNNTNDNKNINKNNLRIYSYNSRGFDQIKQQVCRELLDSKDNKFNSILCNQENFVLKGNSHKIRQALPDYHIFIKPAEKSQLEGRPVNGMFIAIHKQFRTKAKEVSANNKRVQGVLLKTDGDSTLVINVYFPSDPKTKLYNQDEELENVMATIENLIETYGCNNVIIVGDMNTDYKRKNGRVDRLKKFLSDNDLESAWDDFEVDFTHEFEKDGVTYTSTLDYLLWNTELRRSVLNSGVLHTVTNTSDHHPIYFDLAKTFESNDAKPQPDQETKGSISTKALDEEDWNHFTTQLEGELSHVAVPKCADCQNVHCHDDKHKEEVDEYTKNVLGAIDRCIQDVAKKQRNNTQNAKVVPGWTELVQPFCEDAKFWNAVWISAGRPLNSTLHQIMKRTRNKYHYAIRKCKRAEEKILKDKMLNACLAGKENIFDKIKKMRQVKNEAPSAIDGNDSPANRFAQVYDKLYNSTNDKEDTDAMINKIQCSVKEDSIKDVNLVTPDVIKNVISEIKTNKKDPVFIFNSNCVKRAPRSFHLHMANIIRIFLIHGHVSQILLVATIVPPLLKDKQGDIQSSDNYRSIALSSVILKIFDWVVMLLFEDRLGLDDLQFSYQKECSTNMCTWMVVEGINHFTRNDTEVYTCFMDMKKAFDMVKHSLLFQKLIERNIPPIYLRLLLFMYTSQSAKVRWKGSMSDSFSISNGVKQGAVLSAILFCIYIDGLIKELRRKGEGCWINGAFLGIVVYADDIALLSPSIDGLQNMINTCERYAESHNLTFSTHENPAKSKTKCVAFLREKRSLRNLILKGKSLPWVDSVKHLGTTLTNSNGCNLDQDLLEKRARYVSKNNEIRQEFYFAHYRTKIWINNVFNTSFYGAPLWDYSSRCFEMLEKTWNVSARVMLDLPRETLTDISSSPGQKPIT